MFKSVYFCTLFVVVWRWGTCEPCDPSKIQLKVFSDSLEKFESISAAAAEKKPIQKIIVEGQDIPKVCSGLFSSLTVDTIEITDCKIGAFEEGAFEHLPYLKNLILTHNDITEIQPKLFDNTEVRKLNLSHNSISKIDGSAFANMPKLDVVDLSHNNLKKVDKSWFNNSPKLGWLILSHNHLKELPEGFISFKEPHDVNLDIWIRNNELENIQPGAIQNVKNLHSLFLDNNRISTLPRGMFKNVPKVKYLHLDKNRFVCVEEDVLETLKMVEEIHLQSNVLNCDCLKKMRDWGKKNEVGINFLSRSVHCVQEMIENIRKRYGS